MIKRDGLTEKQLLFLVYLFEEESGGEPRVAMDKAGYSSNTPIREVVEPLSDIIAELAVKKMASLSMKAAHALGSILNDPNQLGAANKHKAAESILNRVGASKKEDIKLNIPETGLVILPAKRKRDYDLDEQIEDNNV